MITTAPNRAYPELNVERRIEAYLAISPHPGLRRLRATTEQGAVVLTGEVASYYEKQLAWGLASRVAGARHVIDDVRVRPHTSTSRSS